MIPPAHLPDLLAMLETANGAHLQVGPVGSSVRILSVRRGLFVRVCPLTLACLWFGARVRYAVGEA